jgi:hypothetical protein
MKRPHFSILKDYKDGILKHLSNEGSTRRHDLSLMERSFGQVATNEWVLRTCTVCEGPNHNKQVEMKRKYKNNFTITRIFSNIQSLFCVQRFVK